MTLPYRKPNRLTEYNYSQIGAYFITICVQDRHAILSEIVGGGDLDAPEIVLSEYGIIIEKYIKSMHSDKADISVDSYIIMPDHIHFIVSIINNVPSAMPSYGMSRSPSPTNAIIPKMISAFKRFTSKELDLTFGSVPINTILFTVAHPQVVDYMALCM